MADCPICGSDSMEQEIDPRCINCESFHYDFDKDLAFCVEDKVNPVPVDEVSCDLLDD